MTEHSPNKSRIEPVQRGALHFLRFLLGVLVIFLLYLGLMIILKGVFLAANWSAFRPQGFISIGWALAKGLRFDIAILSYLLLPALFLYFAAFTTNWGLFRWILTGYLVVTAFIISVFFLTDLQYFEESGKHLTSEVLDYLGISLWPDISGAFRLHPWLSSLSVLSTIGLAVGATLFFQWFLHVLIPAHRAPFPVYLVALFLPIPLLVIGARGGLQHFPLHIGDALISPNPYLNALCLNPLYSTFKTLTSRGSSDQILQYATEASNIQVVRELLDCPPQVTSPRYPLLRSSPGKERGNRKNVVIFLLESWSAKDIGCLGSNVGLTPVFDDLARNGLLFTRFYATGIRTPEGVFSLLCSFPNQPGRPIMGWNAIYQGHWRSLSQILGEIGYRNLFIYGRDLDFARIKELLRFIGFHQVIDKGNFPATAIPTHDAWSGYDDEEVMRRADEAFAGQVDRPFFAVVSTMNTHPPFVTPKGFPLPYPPTSVENRYLNALKYSDSTLGLFFRLAHQRDYFRNTLFLFVADHARTRDILSLSSQHHIPLLIYAPGYVPPGINPVVGSQVDLLPITLGLLQLKTAHASWGRDLLHLEKDQGFAVSVSGDEVRWRNSRYLLNDVLTDLPPQLFDIRQDPDCRVNVLSKQSAIGDKLKVRERAYIALSQSLLLQNRVYP